MNAILTESCLEPMRIRAHLLDGRVAGTEPFFPLDSILAAEWIRRNYPGSFYEPPPPGVNEGWIEAPLPLERRGVGRGAGDAVVGGDNNSWYYACSFNQAAALTEYVTYWHRRFDDAPHLERYLDFKGRRGKVDGKSGRFKAYRMPLNILLLPYLEWYAVGDVEAMRELCSGVAAIGKKPAQGYGIVERWEVEIWPEDWSEVGPDGRLTRAVYELPAEVESGGGGDGDPVPVQRLYGMRPPYWKRENQARVWMP